MVCKLGLMKSEQGAGEYSGDGIGEVYREIVAEYVRKRPRFLPQIFVRFDEDLLSFNSTHNLRSLFEHDVYYEKIICTGHTSSLNPGELAASCDECPYNGSGKAKEACPPSGVV